MKFVLPFVIFVVLLFTNVAQAYRSVRATAITPWLPTFRCETYGIYDWHINTSIYKGGLQFDHWTWTRFGGLKFAYDAHLATPKQQVLVASRVTYDAWPHCPNPPRIR